MCNQCNVPNPCYSNGGMYVPCNVPCAPSNSCNPCNPNKCGTSGDEIMMFFMTLISGLSNTLNVEIVNKIKLLSAITYCAIMRIKKLCIKKCYIKKMICQILALVNTTVDALKALSPTAVDFVARLDALHSSHLTNMEMIFTCNYPKKDKHDHHDHHEHDTSSSSDEHDHKHKHKHHKHKKCCDPCKYEDPTPMDYDKWRVFRHIEVSQLYLNSCFCTLPAIFAPVVLIP